MHGILKQHQVHDSVDLVVGLQSLLQCLAQRLPGGHGEVLGLSYATGKMAVDQWLCLQGLFVQVLERGARGRGREAEGEKGGGRGKWRGEGEGEGNELSSYIK